MFPASVPAAMRAPAAESRRRFSEPGLERGVRGGPARALELREGLQVLEAAQRVGIAEAGLGRGRRELPGEDEVVSLHHEQRRHVEHALVADGGDERVVDGLIEHGVDEDGGARLHRHARARELGGVHGDAQAPAARLVHHRVEQGAAGGGVVPRPLDEPDLDEVRLARASRATSARASAGEATFTIGGSPRSSWGRATVDTSGPPPRPAGASAVRVARSRTSKFHIGPPASTTEVTPHKR
jgi:hypothetical protein